MSRQKTGLDHGKNPWKLWEFVGKFRFSVDKWNIFAKTLKSMFMLLLC
jgi:hypothetical protein